jgi:uncharacterized membrane protein
MQKFLTVFGVEIAIFAGVMFVAWFGVYALLWLFLRPAKRNRSQIDETSTAPRAGGDRNLPASDH